MLLLVIHRKYGRFLRRKNRTWRKGRSVALTNLSRNSCFLRDEFFQTTWNMHIMQMFTCKVMETINRIASCEHINEIFNSCFLRTSSHPHVTGVNIVKRTHTVYLTFVVMLMEFLIVLHIKFLQNYWVFGLSPLSDILETRKTRRFGNWICFRHQVRGKTPTQLGPLEKANFNH
jgi:hypothetical protein